MSTPETIAYPVEYPRGTVVTLEHGTANADGTPRRITLPFVADHGDTWSFEGGVVVRIAGWRLVTATRPVPPTPAPGATGTATVHGVEGVHGTWCQEGGNIWFAIEVTPSYGVLEGLRGAGVVDVTDFVPDPDTAAPRRAVCTCGTTGLGIVHRADGPCYHAEEAEDAEMEADELRSKVTHLETLYADATARADAAEARLARLTEDAIADAIIERTRNGGGPHDAALVILALVAADEQAAEGVRAPGYGRAAELIRFHLQGSDISASDRAELAAFADYLDAKPTSAVNPESVPGVGGAA